ncbi:hypothetical protein A2U01_0091709, partial [Trifolium medium]|nr:hypothetical protein [Trifolium medium]
MEDIVGHGRRNQPQKEEYDAAGCRQRRKGKKQS